MIEDAPDRFVQRHDRRDRVGTGGVAGKLGGVAGGFTWAGRGDLRDIDHLAGCLSRFEILQVHHRILRRAEDVRSVEGDRQRERPVRVSANEVGSLAGEQVGAILMEDLHLAITRELRVEVIDERTRRRGDQCLVEAAALMGHRAGAMPFAEERRAVAGGLQQAGQERDIGRDAVAVAVEAEALLIAAAEEAGSGWPAERGGGVTGRELHALLGETIQVRGLHRVAEEAAHVAAAEVVDEHDDHVRLGALGVAGKSRTKGQHQGQQGSHDS